MPDENSNPTVWLLTVQPEEDLSLLVISRCFSTEERARGYLCRWLGLVTGEDCPPEQAEQRAEAAGHVAAIAAHVVDPPDDLFRKSFEPELL